MVYRLVGGVYLMVVAAVQANVLWLLNLLDACVRVLTGIAKSVEVTPDKLARRYPEVCFVLRASRHIFLHSGVDTRCITRLYSLVSSYPAGSADDSDSRVVHSMVQYR